MNGQDVHVCVCARTRTCAHAHAHTHTHTRTRTHTHRNHLLLFQHHKYTCAENNMAQDRRGTSAGDSYGNFVQRNTQTDIMRVLHDQWDRKEVSVRSTVMY